MRGRKVYEFALTNVPSAMKECLDMANTDVSEVKKILIHQANAKMDDAIVKRLYKLYNKELPVNILPMNIQSLGNSSVATIPTLFDQVLRNEIINHKLNKNDIVEATGGGVDCAGFLGLILISGNFGRSRSERASKKCSALRVQKLNDPRAPLPTNHRALAPRRLRPPRRRLGLAAPSSN